MGRRSRPKPPPDYTPQRNAARDSTMQTYQQQADAYNAAVADYNQRYKTLKTPLLMLAKVCVGLVSVTSGTTQQLLM